MTTRAKIPQHGRDAASILQQLRDYGVDDVKWRQGRVFSLIYSAGDEHEDFLKQASSVYYSENALNPMAFPSLRRMETEVVQITANLLHGDDKVVGSMTTGGTESLLLAVMSYRDRARKLRPWIRRPNVVLPTTAHPAFDKAAHYFGVQLRRIAVHDNGEVDVAAMAKAINRNTILLVGSAPQYPHGVVDPIAAIGKLAEKHKLPLHVDACVGGYILPFLERTGVAVPLWDFRVPAVTSISADTHKYGYTSKGASVLLHRSMDTFKSQIFVDTDNPSGIYASVGLVGTKAGSAMAAAWSSLQKLGEDGYVALAQDAWQAAQKVRAGIAAIPGLRVVGPAHATIVAWGASEGEGKGLDVFAIADQLAARGWFTDRQQFPTTIHMTLAAHHLPFIDAYLDDVKAAVAIVRANPELRSSGQAVMYGMMSKIPMRGFVAGEVRNSLASMYETGEPLDISEKKPGFMGWVQENQGKILQVLDKVDALRRRK